MRVLSFLGVASLLISTLFLTAGCGSGGIAPRLFETSEHERYAKSLEALDLDRSAMGSAWFAAGSTALKQPQTLKPPWREEIFFSPDRPSAVAWQLDLERGRRMRAMLSTPPGDSRFFLQLFAVRAEDEAPDVVAERTQAGELVYDVDEAGTFLLRMQPELLAGGMAVLEVTAGGQLAFPVEGRDESSIGSRFGDPRDGGRRSHEGVDIFAPRGTLALAATDGTVTRVGNNRLGGKVIWMRGGGQSFYYAHLDEQLVGRGRVSAGEAIGRVGNTGNASGTPPHLHFGLYEGSAIDPLPYLASAGEPPEVEADREVLGEAARISSRLARLRAGPSTRHDIRDELEQNTAVELEAANRDWYRVRLADGRHGYMAASLLRVADEPLRRLRSESDSFVLHRPSVDAPRIARVAAGDELRVLGELEPYLLVATADDVVGWVDSTTGWTTD